MPTLVYQIGLFFETVVFMPFDESEYYGRGVENGFAVKLSSLYIGSHVFLVNLCHSLW